MRDITKEEPKTDLERFWDEMKKLASSENYSGRGHFNERFDPKELTEDDMELYYRFKSSVGGKTNIAEIQNRILDTNGNVNKSQKQLYAYIINQLQARIG